METIKMWKLGPNGNHKAAAIEPVACTDTEQLLENVLTASPELLLPDLVLVGRQTPTPGGPLDLIGVDEDGRLVVFELKKGTLTRDAVAQAIDYTSFLAELEPDDLCQLISANSGKLGIEKIDFAQWYESEYPEQPVAEIGAPRIVLVGLGVDDRARRMINFLGKSKLDISLITFHGFSLNGETLLARQVEVQGSTGLGGVKKAENEAILDKTLVQLGIKENYDQLVAAVVKGLGDSAYNSPHPTGYSFYLREIAASGRPTMRSYLSLYVPGDKGGKIQIVMQARAVEAVDSEGLHSLAKSMGSKFDPKATGWGEIWIDGHKAPSNYSGPLMSLAQSIAAGWKTKMEKVGEQVLEEPQTV